MHITDTISAISTPFGKGGIAVVRISGDNAIHIADKIFSGAAGKPLSEIRSGRVVYGEILDGESRESIDDVLVSVFRAPHSFTGEDTVEISCHGGVLVTRRVFEATLTAGARAAQAGEFTRRAYVSGKLDLSRAEALGSLLEAENDAQLKLARNGMRGTLTDKTLGIYSRLRAVLASIYAVIDFPDEDLSDMSREQIYDEITATKDEIFRLAETYKTARATAEGIPTVICGRTNAGKSSLYNRILGYEAAIVTDIEGTTRDILRERASLGKVILRLCDTAGIRHTEDTVESIGIERAIKEIEEAELILPVFDAHEPLTESDIGLIDKLSDMEEKCVVAVLNKKDMGINCETSSQINARFENVVTMSTLDGEGFSSLVEKIEELFIDGSIDIVGDAIVMGARQHTALIKADSALKDALTELEAGTPLDICCSPIEEAMASVAEVDGREISEEIVSEIFSKFCVGK